VEATPPPTFAKLLKRHRLVSDLTQEALAERAHLSREAVSALERGERQYPRRDTVGLLAEALELSNEERGALLTAAARPSRPRLVDSSPASSTESSAADVPVMRERTIVPRSQLPVPLTPLLGRTEELEQAWSLLARDGVRVLTLTGPGGIGKTRLALHVAAAARDTYADGAVFVDLSPLTGPAMVGTALAAVLGVRPSGGESGWGAAAAVLLGREALLVLDNVEQVVAAAPDLARLLEACSRVAVLATSRVALRIRGEQQLQVPPLAVPGAERASASAIRGIPAVQLFVARAQAVQPTFTLTAGTAPVVAEICRRLDGIPLAIELAAPRVRLLGPDALLARLDRRLAVLTGGSRDLPARQQTMRATIDWSYGLLDETARRLFARMAVFAGGGTLEALEAVCADGESDVLSGMEILLDSSLAIRLGDGEPRAGMLETIREYARDRLRGLGEEEERSQAHARYYLNLAEDLAPDLTGSEQVASLARLQREQENLRAALGGLLERNEAEAALLLVAALWRMWFMSGQAAEGRRWIEATLALDGTLDDVLKPLRMRALRGISALCLVLADLRAGETFARQSLALARELNDPLGSADVLNSLGNLLRNRGEAEAAIPYFEESLALFRQAGDARGISMTLNNLGAALRHTGDSAQAVGLHEESLAIRRRLEDSWGVAMILLNLGLAALNTGDLSRGASAGEETLALSRRLGNAHGVALALDLLGRVDQAERSVDRAIPRFVESLRVSREVGDRGLVADTLMALAAARAQTGDALRATRLLAAAVTIQASLRSESEWGGRRDAVAAATRVALGDEGFCAAWAVGEALSWREAIDEAVGSG
jgi:predicted ATPase/transcriptional regulator with XRE-family HTH domain